jgi:hypothetical protein
LSSLTPRRALAGHWESRSRTHAPPPRRGPHANGCARPFIRGRHHPGADSQNPSRAAAQQRCRRPAVPAAALFVADSSLGGAARVNRPRRKLRRAEPHLFSLPPRPEAHRNTAAAGDQRRPPLHNASGHPAVSSTLVSTQAWSPRLPPPFPHHGRARERFSRRRFGPPGPPPPCLVSCREVGDEVEILHLDPYPFW